jgi:SAM-dependent methyltransferase
MQQGWDAEAGNWAKFARTPGYDRAHERINRPALLALLPVPGGRTLDLACGEGRISRLLRSLGHAVVGVDASPAMVRLAVTHEEGAGAVLARGSDPPNPPAVLARGDDPPNPPAVLGDAGWLPFADEAFDLVVAYMCLHDIDEMPRAVKEIARVLEPSGRLCLAIPHPLNSAGAFESREADAPFVITGSYMEPAPLRDTIERADARLTFHSEHRPLEAYFRALESASLLVDALREVAAGEESIQHDPDKRWQRIPMFLHMRVVKPA